MKRRSLTRKEKAAMIEAQGGLCGCGCGQPVTMETGHGEHYTPVVFGNDKKPDAVWRTDCHLIKTRRDRKNIAKVKRLAKGPKQPKGRPIPSRPFDKAKRKLQSRAVERRT